ncbi:MAG: CRISPR-associated protein Cas4 [Thermoplasmatota archaeon]
MVSAGQVEQFAYCAHNWWLARGGVDGKGVSSARGLAEHRALGAELAATESDREENRDGLLLSLLFVSLAASLTLLVLVLYATSGFNGGRQVTLAIMALVLVSASSALWTLGILAERRLRRRGPGRLAPGRLLSSDLAGQAPLFSDPVSGLTGRPDYILATQQGTVPVEVKTGHTPERPHRSHVLQLASYLHLVEVREGKPPPYGLIQYPEGFFRVDWDLPLRQDLASTLDRMGAAEAAGRADRDHEQPGRCRGCSRRLACDQKLV